MLRRTAAVQNFYLRPGVPTLKNEFMQGQVVDARVVKADFECVEIENHVAGPLQSWMIA